MHGFLYIGLSVIKQKSHEISIQNESKMKYRSILYSLFILPSVLLAQSFTISGYLNDKKNGETLIGAVAIVRNNANRGTASNEYGFYSLTLPQGSYELAYSFIGYQEQTINVNLTENKTINISLDEFITNIGEVVVSATRVNEKISQSKMGVEKVNVAAISKLPVLFGERDILKTMQLLPGVKSGGDGQSGFTVRGGSIDQNLILLDDAPVYNASHLLGFFLPISSRTTNCLFTI